MLSASDWLGVPVFEQHTGKRLGKVRDFLVDKSWHVIGVLLEERIWFSPAKYVEWQDITVIGSDSWMIRDRKLVRPYRPKEHADTSFLCRGDRRILGIPLMSEEGTYVGRIEDVYFSPKMEDLITGFELSEGLWTDLQDGRKRLPLPKDAARGEDVILASAESLKQADRLTIEE